MLHAVVGRTTFVNTLCGRKVLQGKDADDATNAHLEEGVRIKPITVGAYGICVVQTFGGHAILLISCLELELDEEGTRISLTIVDTPGFGDQIDNEARFVPQFPGACCGAISVLIRAASLRLSDTSSANMMTSSLKNRGSSAIQGSGTIVSMLYSTSSPPLVMGQYASTLNFFAVLMCIE